MFSAGIRSTYGPFKPSEVHVSKLGALYLCLTNSETLWGPRWCCCYRPTDHTLDANSWDIRVAAVRCVLGKMRWKKLIFKMSLWRVTDMPTNTVACDRDPHQHCCLWQISPPTAHQGNNTEKCFNVLFRVPCGELCIWIGQEIAWFLWSFNCEIVGQGWRQMQGIFGEGLLSRLLSRSYNNRKLFSSLKEFCKEYVLCVAHHLNGFLNAHLFYSCQLRATAVLQGWQSLVSGAAVGFRRGNSCTAKRRHRGKANYHSRISSTLLTGKKQTSHQNQPK